MRKLWYALSILLVAVLVLTAGNPVAAAKSSFPDQHKNLLSAGSYAWLYGPKASHANTAGPASPTGVGRPPRVGPNMRVNDPQQFFPNGLVGRSETSIAATTDGSSLVAGWNDAQGFCGQPWGGPCTPPAQPGLSGFGYSTNSGASWTDAGSPPLFNNVFTRGDPWLDLGGTSSSATAYYANLSVDYNTGADLGVSIHRGNFSGGSFNWQDVQVLTAPRNLVTPNTDFYDKEALAAAKDGSGAVYATVTNFQALCGQPEFGNGQIEVWRSHDSGATWQGPVVAGPEASDSVASCGYQGTIQQGSAPAIGPNGELYVVWQYGPTFTTSISTGLNIVVATSLDGGKTFSAPVSVAGVNSAFLNPPAGFNRPDIITVPRIAVATTGAYKGRVYVSYFAPVAPVSAPSITSNQVYLSYSDDQGKTWSAPQGIASIPNFGVKRIWPVVSVEPGGTVDVVYQESQETPINYACVNGEGFNYTSLVDTWWVQSSDGGATFKAPIKVSSATSDWCATATDIYPNFGDYIGSASGGNRVFPLWADGRNGVPDVYFSALLGAGK